MSDDPWASDPSQDIPPWEINSNQDSQVAKRNAQPEPAPEAKTEVVKETKTVVAESDNTGISVTFKGAGGFDQPWIVVHAKDAQDALDTVSDQKFGELIKKTAQVGAYWAEIAGGSGGSAPAASRQEKKDTPPKAADPEPGKHFCAHGAMEYRSGVSDSGKTWAGWFCQGKDAEGKFLPKDEKCDVQWPARKK